MGVKQKRLRDNRQKKGEKIILVVIMEWAFPALCEKHNQVAPNRN